MGDQDAEDPRMSATPRRSSCSAASTKIHLLSKRHEMAVGTHQHRLFDEIVGFGRCAADLPCEPEQMQTVRRFPIVD
jgi:hypothetical protein